MSDVSMKPLSIFDAVPTHSVMDIESYSPYMLRISVNLHPRCRTYPAATGSGAVVERDVRGDDEKERSVTVGSSGQGGTEPLSSIAAPASYAIRSVFEVRDYVSRIFQLVLSSSGGPDAKDMRNILFLGRRFYLLVLCDRNLSNLFFQVARRQHGENIPNEAAVRLMGLDEFLPGRKLPRLSTEYLKRLVREPWMSPRQSLEVRPYVLRTFDGKIAKTVEAINAEGSAWSLVCEHGEKGVRMSVVKTALTVDGSAMLLVLKIDACCVRPRIDKHLWDKHRFYAIIPARPTDCDVFQRLVCDRRYSPEGWEVAGDYVPLLTSPRDAVGYAFSRGLACAEDDGVKEDSNHTHDEEDAGKTLGRVFPVGDTMSAFEETIIHHFQRDPPYVTYNRLEKRWHGCIPDGHDWITWQAAQRCGPDDVYVISGVTGSKVHSHDDFCTNVFRASILVMEIKPSLVITNPLQVLSPGLGCDPCRVLAEICFENSNGRIGSAPICCLPGEIWYWNSSASRMEYHGLRRDRVLLGPGEPLSSLHGQYRVDLIKGLEHEIPEPIMRGMMEHGDGLLTADRSAMELLVYCRGSRGDDVSLAKAMIEKMPSLHTYKSLISALNVNRCVRTLLFHGAEGIRKSLLEDTTGNGMRVVAFAVGGYIQRRMETSRAADDILDLLLFLCKGETPLFPGARVFQEAWGFERSMSEYTMSMPVRNVISTLAACGYDFSVHSSNGESSLAKWYNACHLMNMDSIMCFVRGGFNLHADTNTSSPFVHCMAKRMDYHSIMHLLQTLLEEPHRENMAPFNPDHRDRLGFTFMDYLRMEHMKGGREHVTGMPRQEGYKHRGPALETEKLERLEALCERLRERLRGKRVDAVMMDGAADAPATSASGGGQ